MLTLTCLFVVACTCSGLKLPITEKKHKLNGCDSSSTLGRSRLLHCNGLDDDDWPVDPTSWYIDDSFRLSKPSGCDRASFTLSFEPPPAKSNKFIAYFVPGFVAVWAGLYGFIFAAETGGTVLRRAGHGPAMFAPHTGLITTSGLGDLGGQLGVALTVVLFFALVTVTLFEIFRPESELEGARMDEDEEFYGGDGDSRPDAEDESDYY